MNCRQFRNLLAEFEEPGFESARASAETMEHLGRCASCASLLKRDQALRAGLRQLAVRQGQWEAPARLETTLLREFRAQSDTSQQSPHVHPRRLAPNFAPLPVGILSAGALAAALAAFLLWSHPPTSRAVPSSDLVAASDVDDSTALESGFIPLPYFGDAGLLSGPAADADVVRVEMPRSTLVALGVPVADDGGAEAVQAELLLGAGGMPQAVRILE
jgi:hypothetical protein